MTEHGEPGVGLLAPADLVEHLGAPRGIVFLVGGYDGAGNFGDLRQLEQAARLVARLGERVAAVPVIDADNLANSRGLEFAPLAGCDPHRALVAGAPGAIDGLVAAELPASAVWAATYLFGGGYLNSAWARSRLDMVRAVDDLTRRSALGRPALVSSGIQVDAEWLRALGGADLDLINRLARLGVRNAVPADARPPGFEPKITETADDAVGAFAAFPARETSSALDGAEPVSLNLQIASHPWMYADPDAPIAYLSRFVDELGAAGGDGAAKVQPLIAFEDSRTRERPAYEAFVEHPLEGRRQLVAAPAVMLGEADLSVAAERIQRAHVTVCGSYHTALFSLMLGVPAAVVVDNAHYRDKAKALLRAFHLPDEFALALDGDARESARRVASVLTGDRLVGIQGELIRGRERLIAVRARTETAVIGALAAAYADALAEYADELAAEAQGRDAPTLTERISALRADFAAALDARAQAEARTAELTVELDRERASAERLRAELAELRGSRSWRLTAPLREGRTAAADRLRGVIRRPGSGSES